MKNKEILMRRDRRSDSEEHFSSFKLKIGKIWIKSQEKPHDLVIHASQAFKQNTSFRCGVFTPSGISDVSNYSGNQ